MNTFFTEDLRWLLLILWNVEVSMKLYSLTQHVHYLSFWYEVFLFSWWKHFFYFDVIWTFVKCLLHVLRNDRRGLRPATLLKKRHWHRCFPVNFVKFLRKPQVAAFLMAGFSNDKWVILFAPNNSGKKSML